MATSLLRLGRLGSLKVIQKESWGLLRSSSAAAFCTKAGGQRKLLKRRRLQRWQRHLQNQPPEPFDNSTYKNLQHHNYNHYTFADLDLEMAKYRLPQPSSGRPSPRH